MWAIPGFGARGRRRTHGDFNFAAIRSANLFLMLKYRALAAGSNFAGRSAHKTHLHVDCARVELYRAISMRSALQYAMRMQRSEPRRLLGEKFRLLWPHACAAPAHRKDIQPWYVYARRAM